MKIISVDTEQLENLSIELAHQYNDIGMHYAYHNGIGSQPFGNSNKYASVFKAPNYENVIVNFANGMMKDQYGSFAQLSAKFWNMFSSDYSVSAAYLSDIPEISVKIKENLLEYARKLVYDNVSILKNDSVYTVELTSINDLSCIDVSNITEIYIPQNITQLPNCFLSDAVKLNQIYFGPDANSHQLTSIGESAFCNSYALECLNFPNKLRHIGDYAFANCSSITAIVLGSSYVEYDSNTVFKNVDMSKCFFSKNYNDRKDLINKSLSILNLFSQMTYSAEPVLEHDWSKKGKHVYDITNSYKDPLSIIKTQVNVTGTWNVLGAVLSAAETVADLLMDCLTNVIDKFTTIIVNLLGLAWNLFLTIVGKGWIWEKSEKEDIVNAFVNYWNKNCQSWCNDVYTEIKNWLTNQFQNGILNVIIEYINGKQTSIQATFNAARIAVSNIDDAISKGESEFIKLLKEGLNSAAEGAQNNVGQKTIELISDMSDDSALNEIGNVVWNIVSGKYTKEEFFQLWSNLKDSIKDHFTDFSQSSKDIGFALDTVFNLIVDDIWTQLQASKIVKYTINDAIEMSSTQYITAYMHEMWYCAGDVYHDEHVECRSPQGGSSKCYSFDWKENAILSTNLITFQNSNFLVNVGAALICYASIYGTLDQNRILTLNDMKDKILNNIYEKKQEFDDLEQECPTDKFSIDSINNYYAQLNGK